MSTVQQHTGGASGAPAARPASEGWLKLSAIGIGLAVVWALACTAFRIHPFVCAMGAIGIYAAPQLARALREARETIRRHGRLYADRVVLRKYLAVAAVLTLFYLALVYFPGYQDARYAPTRAALGLAYPLLLIAAYPYICIVNAMQREAGDEDDEYSHVGKLLLGQFDKVDPHKLKHFALGWAVKLFFFPLMFWELYKASGMTYRSLDAFAGGFFDYIFISTAIIYFIDVTVAAAGYLFTLRLFGWQIRSVQPFVVGWVFTLMCYYPFITWVYPMLFAYKSGFTWDAWLAGAGPILYVWAGAILALKVTWIVAIASFGLRFSNLTNRGIITDGVYALTKHPSYVSKNLFWWLIYIPFIPVTSTTDAVQNCLALLAVNLIYVIRARYEERHLSEEPGYVAYALWMEQHGVFRHVTRLAPWLRYRTPEEQAPLVPAWLRPARA